MNKKKQYAPFNVIDPSSMQHMVRISPGQTIRLSLDEQVYPNPKVESSGGVLFVSGPSKRGNRNEYTIWQIPYTTEWADYSSAFLGEIHIDSDHHSARLECHLEGLEVEKRHHLSIINPDCVDIRIKPYNVLEVIVYDKTFEDKDEWGWEWSPLYDLDIEQIGYSYISLNTWKAMCEIADGDDPSHPYARLPRASAYENSQCRQHHFWFRFDKSILKFVDGLSEATKVGDLYFCGWPDRLSKQYDKPKEYYISVHMSPKDINKSKMEATLGMSIMSKMDPAKPKLQGKVTLYPPLSPVRATIVKPKKPQVRQVSFGLLSGESLGDNCETLPAVLTKEELEEMTRDTRSQQSVCNVRSYPFHGRGMGMARPHYMDYDDSPDWWLP